MEALDRSLAKIVLSPEPKRVGIVFSAAEGVILSRPQSCEIENPFIVSELSDILGLTNSTPGRNSSPLFSRFSQVPPNRSETNPIVSDEKFIQLQYSFSTSEDSGSDSDRGICNTKSL